MTVSVWSLLDEGCHSYTCPCMMTLANETTNTEFFTLLEIKIFTCPIISMQLFLVADYFKIADKHLIL